MNDFYMQDICIFHLFASASLSPCPMSPFYAIFFSYSVSSLLFVFEILNYPNALISSALFAVPPAFIIFSSILFKYYY